MIRSALLPCLLALASPAWASEPTPPCHGSPEALGTSRTIFIGPEATTLGLKTYPRTLALADHEVVLTFDDGPSRATTPRVLAALEHECVRATFFLIGRNAADAPALVRQEIADGDTVGHHSFSHPERTERGLSDAAARADIDRGFQADDTAAYGGASPEPRVPFFRFPGFADTPALDAWLAGRHVTVFGADLWASDWVPMTPEAELALLMDRLKSAGRGIVLLHDVKVQTAAILPALLRALKENGFHVVHIVPGGDPTPTMDAPVGWTSDTEAALARIMPKLLLHASKARGRAPVHPALPSAPPPQPDLSELPRG